MSQQFSNLWAITNEGLRQVQAVAGQSHTYHAQSAGTGREAPLRVNGGTAVIPVAGVLLKNPSFLLEILGGTAMKLIGQQVRKALDDPAVKRIVLAVDSPGGQVDGTQELAQAIFQARGKKPIIAFVEGMMASAAYWIGAAADEIVVGGGTVALGSIGVVATHVDVSKLEESMGVKTTEVVSSQYKRIPSSVEPLSTEGRQVLQEFVDYIHGLFVSDIQKFRSLSGENLKTATNGKIFLGEQALQVGLADRMGSFASALVGGPSRTKAIHAQGPLPTFSAQAHSSTQHEEPYVLMTQTKREIPMDLHFSKPTAPAPQAKTDTDPLHKTKAWQEWQAESAAVKDQCQHSFKYYMNLRDEGLLDSLREDLAEDELKSAMSASERREKEALAHSIEHPEETERVRFQEMLALTKGHPTYRGLHDERPCR